MYLEIFKLNFKLFICMCVCVFCIFSLLYFLKIMIVFCIFFIFSIVKLPFFNLWPNFQKWGEFLRIRVYNDRIATN